MRYRDEQTNDHAEVVTSGPVPVQPTGRDAEAYRSGAASLDDEHRYDADRRTDDDPGSAAIARDAPTSDMDGSDGAEQHDVRDDEPAGMPGDAPGTIDQTAGAQPIDEAVPARDVVDAGAGDPVSPLFAAETAQGFRERWHEVQLRFVDDPRAAAGEAQDLVEEAMAALSAALAEQKSTLAGWNSDDANDTERLRMAVRRYRDFLDRVLAR